MQGTVKTVHEEDTVHNASTKTPKKSSAYSFIFNPDRLVHWLLKDKRIHGGSTEAYCSYVGWPMGKIKRASANGTPKCVSLFMQLDLTFSHPLRLPDSVIQSLCMSLIKTDNNFINQSQTFPCIYYLIFLITINISSSSMKI